MRRGHPPWELGANLSAGERAGRPPPWGQPAGVPRWQGIPAGALPRLRAHIHARPRCPRRTECLDEALSDPVTRHTPFAGLHTPSPSSPRRLLPVTPSQFEPCNSHSGFFRVTLGQHLSCLLFSGVVTLWKHLTPKT